MLHSNLERVVREIIQGDERLEKGSSNFHRIESEIDGMANKSDADLEKILRRAKELLHRADPGFDTKWNGIEERLKYNLREIVKK